MALVAIGAALLAGGIWYSTLDKETCGILAVKPTNADVLSWSQDQRDAAFRALDRLPVLATAADIAPAPIPLPLPAGNAAGKQITPPDGFAMATTKQMPTGEPGHGYGFQWWTYDSGAVAAQGIFGQGIFIDLKRHLVKASDANWTRATEGPEPAAREAFYKQVQALIDAGG